MAPNVNGELKVSERAYNDRYTSLPEDFNFSLIEIGRIMTEGTPAEKAKLERYVNTHKASCFTMRTRLEYVRAHNEPIKQKIAEGKDVIKTIKQSISTVKTKIARCNNPDEQVIQEEMLTSLNREKKDEIRHNCRLAWQLEYI